MLQRATHTKQSPVPYDAYGSAKGACDAGKSHLLAKAEKEGPIHEVINDGEERKLAR